MNCHFNLHRYRNGTDYIRYNPRGYISNMRNRRNRDDGYTINGEDVMYEIRSEETKNIFRALFYAYQVLYNILRVIVILGGVIRNVIRDMRIQKKLKKVMKTMRYMIKYYNEKRENDVKEKEVKIEVDSMNQAIKWRNRNLLKRRDVNRCTELFGLKIKEFGIWNGESNRELAEDQWEELNYWSNEGYKKSMTKAEKEQHWEKMNPIGKELEMIYKGLFENPQN